MPKKQPNIVFIMTDHQRHDSLGMVQAGVEVTPNLNRLAAEGTVFGRAYNTCPLCVPARTALATGIYPTANGAVTNDWKGATAGDCKPMHQFLAEAGYEVAHMGVHHIRVNPPLDERLRFAEWIPKEAYNEYIAARGLATAPPAGEGTDRMSFSTPVMENREGRRVKKGYSNTNTAAWPGDAEHFFDSWVCRSAGEFLNRPHERPFALFVCLWAPHPPLRVPEPYYSMFDPHKLDLPENVGIAAEKEPPGRRRGVAAQLAEGVSMEQWRKVWAAHLGLVRLADDGIGRVLSALERSPAADDTLTVFTVDHGDHLGQHRMYQKMEMYEPAIHVPLVVRVQGAASGRVDRVVSHLDLAPTVLDAAGIPIPASLDGRSLLPAVRDQAPLAERPAFSQYSGNPAVGDLRRAVITQRYKYIHDPNDAPELFDLENDPLEMNNIADDPSLEDKKNALHTLAANWASEHGDWAQF